MSHRPAWAQIPGPMRGCRLVPQPGPAGVIHWLSGMQNPQLSPLGGQVRRYSGHGCAGRRE